MSTPLRGIHYRNCFIYELFTFLKLGIRCHLRYNIAAQYIVSGESVLDVCAGTGRFCGYLPRGCNYFTIEASDGFIPMLSKRSKKNIKINLHEGIEIGRFFRVDVVVMLISLCQFRDTSMNQLLEGFKRIAQKKVVIIEDVLASKDEHRSLKRKIMNYLCAEDYFLPLRLFSFEEFRAVMLRHNYICKRYNTRYAIGYYEC